MDTENGTSTTGTVYGSARPATASAGAYSRPDRSGRPAPSDRPASAPAPSGPAPAVRSGSMSTPDLRAAIGRLYKDLEKDNRNHDAELAALVNNQQQLAVVYAYLSGENTTEAQQLLAKNNRWLAAQGNRAPRQLDPVFTAQPGFAPALPPASFAQAPVQQAPARTNTDTAEQPPIRTDGLPPRDTTGTLDERAQRGHKTYGWIVPLFAVVFALVAIFIALPSVRVSTGASFSNFGLDALIIVTISVIGGVIGAFLGKLIKKLVTR